MSAPHCLEARQAHWPWRGSYDVDDKRADVFRSFGDTLDEQKAMIKAWVANIAEYAESLRLPGKAHRITANHMKVLRAMLWEFADWATGRCEPSYDAIAAKVNFARVTVIRLMSDLREIGAIAWRRRTVKLDDAGAGPQVYQTTNAYFFEPSMLPQVARRGLRARLGGKMPSWPERTASDPVPNKLARMARNLVLGVAGQFNGRLRAASAERRAIAVDLAHATLTEKAAILYPEDEAAQSTWLAMMEQSASCDASPQSPDRQRYKRSGRAEGPPTRILSG